MPNDPIANFRFVLEINGLGLAGFSEVSGLSSEFDVIEYRDGSDPNRIRKFPGLRKYGNVTLMHGITRSKELWDWHNGLERGDFDRRDVVIGLLNAENEGICRWILSNAWPARYEGPLFKADTSAVAVETLVLAHEGLDLDGA